MGVPDTILHKPEELTEEEQQIMRQHPQLAYDMLEPIAYLRDSLDIPYCHHEKWDGTGYPRGLSGAQIPLEARLFAIVDVWDAITTDRPYRKGWPRQKHWNTSVKKVGNTLIRNWSKSFYRKWDQQDLKQLPLFIIFTIHCLPGQWREIYLFSTHE